MPRSFPHSLRVKIKVIVDSTGFINCKTLYRSKQTDMTKTTKSRSLIDLVKNTFLEENPHKVDLLLFKAQLTTQCIVLPVHYKKIQKLPKAQFLSQSKMIKKKGK